MATWRRLFRISSKKDAYPDRLYVEKSAINDYDQLKGKDSPFYGRENKELFIAAMTLGFHENSKKDLSKKEGFVRTEYLTDEEKSLIKAIAIAEEGNLNVLLDKKRVFSIAEEYAAGGIKLLKERVFEEFGSYAKRLESELVKIFEETIKKDLPTS